VDSREAHFVPRESFVSFREIFVGRISWVEDEVSMGWQRGPR
jgi:hypothetical protein